MTPAAHFLHIALIPVDMHPGDARANLDYIERCISELPEATDLVVVPEMCNTGFTVDPEDLSRFAEPADGYSLMRLRFIAREYNVAIWGTMATVDQGRYFNRGFMIDPSGKTDFYDKRHLFVLGQEPALYSPGGVPAPVIEYKGWRIKMAICYDLRFPVWTRWTRNDPYDLLVVPANWPSARVFAWKSLLTARAIENQAYVAGCNRLGSDAYGSYDNDISYVFDCWGNEIGQRDGNSGIILATLDRNQLEHARSRFPNLGAADDFTIENLGK